MAVADAVLCITSVASPGNQARGREKKQQGPENCRTPLLGYIANLSNLSRYCWFCPWTSPGLGDTFGLKFCRSV